MPRIGFNACAPRERYYAGGAAPSMPNDVGPGQYDTAPHKAAKPAFAAFNTSESEHQDCVCPASSAMMNLPWPTCASIVVISITMTTYDWGARRMVDKSGHIEP